MIFFDICAHMDSVFSVEQPRFAPTVKRIQELTAKHFGIREIEMVSARRGRDVARPRQVAMYLSRELTPKSLPHIGRLFGGRDHTTVMHAIRTIERLFDSDKDIREAVEALRAEISTGRGRMEQDENAVELAA